MEFDLEAFGPVGPSAAAEAACIGIMTLRAWTSRRYIGPGPVGLGNSRVWEPLEVLQLAVAAEMHRIGISIGLATKLARAVDRIPQGRAILSIFADKRTDRPEPRVEYVSEFASDEEMTRWLDSFANGRAPYGHFVLDVRRLAKRTAGILGMLTERELRQGIGRPLKAGSCRSPKRKPHGYVPKHADEAHAAAMR